MSKLNLPRGVSNSILDAIMQRWVTSHGPHWFIVSIDSAKADIRRFVRFQYVDIP